MNTKITTSKLEYIFMIHVTKKLDFPQSPLSINNVIKGISNFLDGNFLTSIRINRGTEKSL